MTPGRPDPRPSPYGPADHALAAVWVVACCGALALAAAAGVARGAVAVVLLAGWAAWHGPRLVIEAARPAGWRRGR